MSAEIDAWRIIKNLQNILDMKDAQIHKLEEENHLLKLTLIKVLDFLPLQIPDSIELNVESKNERWIEKSKRMSTLRAIVLKAAIRAIGRKKGQPVHQDDIIREYMRMPYARAVKIKSLGETIGRRLRELREEGYLESPSQGYYTIGYKVLELKRKEKMDLDALLQ